MMTRRKKVGACMDFGSTLLKTQKGELGRAEIKRGKSKYMPSCRVSRKRGGR